MHFLAKNFWLIFLPPMHSYGPRIHAGGRRWQSATASNVCHALWQATQYLLHATGIFPNHWVLIKTYSGPHIAKIVRNNKLRTLFTNFPRE